MTPGQWRRLAAEADAGRLSRGRAWLWTLVAALLGAIGACAGVLVYAWTTDSSADGLAGAVIGGALGGGLGALYRLLVKPGQGRRDGGDGLSGS
jgi:hypothetical protein